MTESNDCYFKRFKANVSTVELAQGSSVYCNTELMIKAGATPTAKEIETESDHFKAILFLKCSDEKRYGALSNNLNSGALRNCNKYPKTLFEMYELMCTTCPRNLSNINKIKNGKSG